MEPTPDRTVTEDGLRFELYLPRRYDKPRKSTLLAFDVASGEQVGQMWWLAGKGRGELTDIYVAPQHRRRGVATAMWQAAMRMPGTTPTHSPRRTESGDRWARSLGEDLPDLRGGTFATADYRRNDSLAG